MIKNIEACIFDLDGTLVDSMWMWPEIDIEYLGRLGIKYDDNLKQVEAKTRFHLHFSTYSKILRSKLTLLT